VNPQNLPLTTYHLPLKYMFELKRLSSEEIPAALEKARHYRLLNEPSAAESICLDILEVEPDNQEALVVIVLAMSDRFNRDYAVGDAQIQSYLSRLTDAHEKAYYTGIVYERRAKAHLRKNSVGSEETVFELFSQAMKCFEKAENSPRSADAKLRWNQCARIIMRNKLAPREKSYDFDFIE
jgi:hypothetical protein